jgi:alanine racemase
MVLAYQYLPYNGNMRALLRKIRSARFRYEPLVSIFIHRDRLLHNLREFQRISPATTVAPVLKSNAYGHGLVEVAGILDKEHLPFFCIDSYVEALILRNEGIRTPLLILGYTSLGNILHNRLANISFGVTSLEELKRLCAQAKRPVTIHLKIDTGMHRQGIMPAELEEALRSVRDHSQIKADGIYSHFADADMPNSKFTAPQIERWNAAVRQAKASLPAMRHFHVSATAGSSHTARINATMMRLGIGLYGFNATQNRALILQPPLEMKTRISSLRTLGPGETIGYNATFETKKEMVIATIPVGYAEGVDRRLSNLGAVTVRGIVCPVVGRVSMNITSIDVSAVPDPHLDEEVLVISAEPGMPNSIERMAELCHTIPYELLVHLPAQIRRTVVS